MEQTEELSTLDKSQEHENELFVLVCLDKIRQERMMKLLHNIFLLNDTFCLMILDELKLGLDLECIRATISIRSDVGDQPDLSKGPCP